MSRLFAAYGTHVRLAVSGWLFPGHRTALLALNARLVDLESRHQDVLARLDELGGGR